MRKFRKYTATALVAMMVAGMTMSGYQPADVSASQESEYIIVTKDKKSMKTVESKYNTMIDTQEQNTDFLKDENVLVSKMTAKEAEDAYRKETETSQLTLTFRGDESETIAGKDFDYTYQDDGEIESFLKKQNPFLWMKYWFEQSEYELKRGIVYDEDKLEKKLNNLSHLSEESQEAPVDAKIVYKEDQFVVKKEKQGTTIDTDALGKAVEQALKEGEETLNVEQAN